MINNITIGSDPEFFLFRKGVPISSVDLIEGTKYYPMPVGDEYYVLKDNVLVEGNIPPVTTKEGFIHNLNTLKQRILDIVGKEFVLECRDSAEYDIEQLLHPEALSFGCSPFLNAWDNEEYYACDLSELNSRVAG